MKKIANKELNEIFGLVLRAVAMAMGVAITIISMLGKGDADSLIGLAGIGIFCLGLYLLDRDDK